jgi:catechol 2,3-dioxygenase-like lactoylglutathione lyase family enzyme
MSDLQSVSHIAFTVTDLARSKEWYTKVLGWQAMYDAEDGGISYSLGTVPGVGIFLTLRHHSTGSGDGFDPGRTGLDHFAFGVDSRGDLEEWEKRFDEMGVTYTPIVDAPYGHVLNFKDPDNIALELFTMPGA